MVVRRPWSLVLAAVAGVLVAAPVSRARGQLIPLRSVPVASGDQFLIHPTYRLGMGSVSIVLDDPWADPFVNPAKGARARGSSFFGTPTFYGISSEGGAGRTLDLAGLHAGRDWFAGGSLALQQIENSPVQGLVFPVFDVLPSFPRRLDESDARNVYVHGLLGRRLNDRLSVGVSAAWANLDAMDGVDLLYQGSDGVDQRGEVVDLRLGIQGRGTRGRTFELLLLYHRRAMTHDVRFVDWVWDEERMQGGFVTRIQEERDETRTWGLHGGLVAPISDAGWQLGAILTANRKTHPKIPNYEIQNIPRDPGDTWAFDAGLGLARERGPFQFEVDAVFEPIWSETWSVADTAIALPDGGRIEAGDKVVENDFFFSNVHLRMGAGYDAERWSAQLGLQTSAYDYTLEQYDNVARTRREQDEAWMEWSPTWGVGVRFPEIELRYSGRVTTGTGRPGVDFVGVRADALASAEFIVAPRGPLTLQDVRVLTHQITVRLPIR